MTRNSTLGQIIIQKVPRHPQSSTMDLQLGRERDASCSELVLLAPAAWTSLALALALEASPEVDQLGNCKSTILDTLLHEAPTVRSTRAVDLPQFACKIEGSSPSPPLLSDPLPPPKVEHAPTPLRNHHAPRALTYSGRNDNGWNRFSSSGSGASVIMCLCPCLKHDEEGGREDVELDNDMDGGGDTFLRRFAVFNDDYCGEEEKINPIGYGDLPLWFWAS